MKVSNISKLTGNRNYMELDITSDQINAYNHNEDSVANIFPTLTNSEKVFLISGVTPEELEEKDDVNINRR
tara:strand:+ start:5958 stop:6170 length:213 start_codon:yes stop_codon:yes gene_type:complete